MYTLEACEKLWEEAGHHGTPAERIARTRAWFPYYGYLAKSARGKSVSRRDAPNPFPAHLLREGVLTPEATVLDIGAGMGGYALELSRYCRRVTALEPCGECLRVLEDRAAQLGIANIKTVQSTWEEFAPQTRYDITFSAMCPAICTVGELRRMESLTRKTCCLITVGRGSQDKHRKAMMAQLGIKPNGGMVTEAIRYISTLYRMGRKPNVKWHTVRSVSRISVEQAMEKYPLYFAIFGVTPEQSRDFLKSYLARNAVDGFLEEESFLRQALIYWDAPNP